MTSSRATSHATSSSELDYTISLAPPAWNVGAAKSHAAPLQRSPGVVVTTSSMDSVINITDGWDCIVMRPSPIYTQGSTTGDSAIDVGSYPSEKFHYGTDSSIDANIATDQELQAITAAVPLPSKLTSKSWRFLRWNFFSVYRKAFTFVLTANLIAIIKFLVHLKYDQSIATYQNAATAASVNFLLTILIRNEHIVNVMFRIVLYLPLWTPLWIRRRAAKVYSYGGIHSGCGVSGTIWYTVFAVLAIFQYPSAGPVEAALAITTGAVFVLLVVILIFAHPTMRTRIHNHFEATHRYGGWSVVALLWAQTMLLVLSDAQLERISFGSALIKAPPFWSLTAITVLLIYPWTRLRSQEVHAEKLSKHATRLHFKHRDLETCMAVRLTDAPLMETHAFATIPNYKGDAKGFSILVSNAGDWTKKVINDPPKKIWIKGAPTVGVMRVALMFKKVLIVATGSGIGPCLSLLQSYPEYPVRVLWSAQDPEKTYGRDIIEAVFRSDPNAVIVDTKRTGRPDLTALAYSILVTGECEAAVVISNPPLTRKVVYGLEARGVPAYGPIFDS